MPEIVSVVISLLCLMVANILIGKKIADFKKEYSKSKFVNGISKAVFSLVGLALIWISTYVFPMEIAEINGTMVTTLSGATILLKVANLYYGGKVLLKIKDLFSINLPVNLLDENGNTKNK